MDCDRVWVDGCFDFTHHGHCGALLQARRTVEQPARGQLYCGVHTDEAITFHKGPPVMHTHERYEHARAIRWCSHVVEQAPYVTDPAWMDKYRCHFVVHGDDITTDAQGNDCYQLVKDMGRFKVVKRTYGVSTTDIIHRILTGARCHKKDEISPTLQELAFYSLDTTGFSPYCHVFDQDLTTVLVPGGSRFEPQEHVLILGNFDLFHMGHIEQLKIVSNNLPDCKITIGLLDSDDNIMTLKERCLSILSCKYIDSVVLKPKAIVKDQFKSCYNIDSPELRTEDPNDFCNYLTKTTIINRIEGQRQLFIDRNKKKGMPV